MMTMSHPRNTKLITVVGCMGSGKTTEIMRLARIESIDKKVLCICNARDIHRQKNRRGDTTTAEICREELTVHGYIETHDGGRIAAILASELVHVTNTPEYAIADVVVVDEAQFFVDLKQFIDTARDRDGKDIIIGALDGDSDMNPFFDIAYVVTRSTSFRKLSALCSFCGEEAGHTRAMFDKKEKIHVGSIGNDYAPCCYLHAKMSYTELPQRKPLGKFVVA